MEVSSFFQAPALAG